MYANAKKYVDILNVPCLSEKIDREPCRHSLRILYHLNEPFAKPMFVTIQYMYIILIAFGSKSFRLAYFQIIRNTNVAMQNKRTFLISRCKDKVDLT